MLVGGMDGERNEEGGAERRREKIRNLLQATSHGSRLNNVRALGPPGFPPFGNGKEPLVRVEQAPRVCWLVIWHT